MNTPDFFSQKWLVLCLLLLGLSCTTPNKSKFLADMVELTCEADHYPGLQGFQKIMDETDSYLLAEGNVDTGVPNGFWKFYFPNGRLWKEGNYTNGRINGFWKLYYENGNLREEGHYLDCERNGFWKIYSKEKNNQVQGEGNFDRGKPVGTWKNYSE